MRRRCADGVFAVWTAIFFEVLDLLCEILEVGDGANKDFKFELLLPRLWLWFILLWFIVIIITALWSVVCSLVLWGDELPQGGEGIIYFCAPGFLDKRVVRLSLSLACSAR